MGDGGAALARARPRRRDLPAAPAGFAAGLVLLPIALVALALALGLTETLVAKLRILLVPRLLGPVPPWRCSPS